MTADATDPRASRAARSRIRMRRRRRRAVFLLVLILILGAGGYTTAVAAAPLPELSATLSVESEVQIDADNSGAEDLVGGESLPTAIGWADGEAVWSNDDQSFPIASISKLVTVLVGLEAKPLEAGADGPVYTWTQADLQRQYRYQAMLGVTFPIPVGTEVTTRQMLELALLPSANDFAAAYAEWVFGSNAKFVEAVDAWKDEHGIESLRIVEPTGLDERNRATAADVVRIARLAVQNETLLEFTSMKTADLPWGIGRIESTNPLLGEVKGVIGLKTGALSVVGYNIAVAQEAEAFEREFTNLAVTLARPTAVERASSARDALAGMKDLPQQLTVVEEGETIGSVLTWQGERVELVTAGSTTSALLPGESVLRTVELGEVAAGSSGNEVGEVRITAPVEVGSIPVVTTAPIVEPDLWWRITHPSELFGG